MSESKAEQCHSFTPPKYQAHKQAEENVLKLEDRLRHFVEWLDDVAGVRLVAEGQTEALWSSRVEELIVQYVET